MVNHDRCVPPPSTAPGTVCVLRNINTESNASVIWKGTSWSDAPGTGGAWVWDKEPPSSVWLWGWRFVRIAEAKDG